MHVPRLGNRNLGLVLYGSDVRVNPKPHGTSNGTWNGVLSTHGSLGLGSWVLSLSRIQAAGCLAGNDVMEAKMDTATVLWTLLQEGYCVDPFGHSLTLSARLC